MLSHAGLIDPAQTLQLFFLLASSTVVTVNAISPFRSRFLVYGSRNSLSGQTNDRDNEAKNPNRLNKILDHLATYRVPHSYFTHFYIASVFSSIFWAFQLVTKGSVFRIISQNSTWRQESTSMTIEKVVLAWLLMTVQGIRRLVESVVLSKPSNSTMWFVHWLLGVTFYIAMGISIWVEGLPKLRSLEPSISLLEIPAPSLRTFLCLPLFLIASGIQHDAHVYLASLPKYTFPKHPIFRFLLCPHYTMECLIYLSLSLIAAPEGVIVNKSVLAGLIFVVINLGVTAGTTREWYVQKFGEEQVRGKWRMIPFIY
ncbi:protein DFG10 [Xylona heveae TC161]|uniref:Polyprenal reductase n=1 Tax=Xylona heveae (strain CBS 132557 / TC161) TaxID=1328760 RepID=A0A165GHR1_XYLHT|nr:protein DFG10 [Xylona heveae TC161]KZF22198.1 protein DFG10 [Xylona heveae TC161]